MNLSRATTPNDCRKVQRRPAPVRRWTRFSRRKRREPFTASSPKITLTYFPPVSTGYRPPIFGGRRFAVFVSFSGAYQTLDGIPTLAHE